jgi:hypothetical protein
MNAKDQWIDWDKPVTIVTRLAKEMPATLEHARLWKPGTFRFNDGTTQGWTIDQLYDTTDKSLKNLPPYTEPATNHFCGFSLSNHQNRALAASANPLMLPGSTAAALDFYLESPDLLSNPDWKNAKGYSLDVQRNFLSLCSDPPSYFVQLQARLWDKTSKTMKVFAEYDEKSKQFVSHAINPFQPYHLLWTGNALADSAMELRFLRIRVTQPNFSAATAPGSYECLPKGAWLVGNIGPEG